MEEMDHSSKAEAKEPEKSWSFIHFSATSQPPRLTPRRKGVLVTAVALEAAGGGEVALELGFEAVDEVFDGLAAPALELEDADDDKDLKPETLSAVEVLCEEVEGLGVGCPSTLDALLVLLKAAVV